MAPKTSHSLTLAISISDASGRPLPQTVTLRFTTDGPSWQPVEDISFLGCRDGLVSHATMDDGSLVAGCTASLDVNAVNNPPVWLRDAQGNWSVLARPAAANARLVALKKLTGSRVALGWFQPDALPNSYTLQVWSSTGGFTTPRASSLSEVMNILPPSRTLPGAGFRNIETGAIESPPFPVSGMVTGVKGCAGSTGAVHLKYLTPQPNGAVGYRVWGISHLPGQGWTTPTQLDTISTLPIGGTTSGAYCFGPSGARFLDYFVYPSLNSEGRQYDLVSGGWLGMRSVSSTGIVPWASSNYVIDANSGGDAGFMAWSDFTRNPMGALNLAPYYPDNVSLLPRLFVGSPSGTGPLSEVSSVPGYDGTLNTELRFIAAVHNPASGRFVILTQGGALNSTQRQLTEIDPATRVWTQPWSLPIEFSDQRVAGPFSMNFNASGLGVAIQGGPARIIMSTWR